MNNSDLEAAREAYFAAGGVESDLGPRDDASWYWRRAAKLWRIQAGGLRQTPAQPDPPIADPAERAQAVALELRRRGIWANAMGRTIWTLRFDEHGDATNGDYSMVWPSQEQMGPRAIADEIQREEARRAAEWAGDEGSDTR